MIAKKIKKVFKEFGKERIDNYYWMRNKKDPDVLRYIKYENKETEKFFKDAELSQDKIFEELKSRKKEKDESYPVFYNGYWYYKKFEKGKEYPIHLRKKKSLKAKPEKIIDQNILAKGKKYFKLGGAAVSPDNKLFLYSEDITADKKFNIKVKDIVANKNLKDEIKGVAQYFVWSNDSKSFFYVEYDKTQRPFKVKRHVLGEKRDETVFEDKTGNYYVSITKTRSKDFVIIQLHSFDHEYQYYFKADGGLYVPKLFKKAKSGVIYEIDHANDTWYIKTNEKVSDFEILKTKDGKKFESFIQPKNNSRIRNFEIFENYFVYEEVKEGIIEIKVLNLKNKKEKTIKFTEKVYLSEISGNPEYKSSKLRIFFESPKYPETEIEYGMESGKKKTLKVHNPKGKYDPDKYIVERIWATASDKKKIPITLFYKKGIKKDGSNPCLIYGYGSYGHSIYPNFNEDRLTLVDRGVIFAIAHIRGGQEMGRQWYLDGKLLNKKNTFTDFISCSEKLIKEKYTNNKKLIAQGGSAGGLLMGAVCNMRPDLYKGMVFQVPFVDSLNTMLDETIPLTVGEYAEWGNPNKKKYYEYMRSYAPYENIENKEYPTIFVDAGFNDTQVHYWESLKYVAKMKEYKKGENPILLNMDIDTGHGGKPGRFSYLYTPARIFSFVFKILGINK